MARRSIFKSPLRYPGGKGPLVNFIKHLLYENELIGGEYIEAYAGGAAIGVTLLLDNFVSKIHINDLSKPLYAFWHSVLTEPDLLCKKVRDTNITIDEWKKQKNVQKDLNSSLLDLGFSTLFLNRSNRSGILSGGVIGGKAQNGTWKLDARFNKIDIISRIANIAKLAEKILLYNEDASDFIQKKLPLIPKNALLYLDPPYYFKGKGLYENYYSHKDHSAIADLIHQISQNWILSYDNCPQITSLYSGFRIIEYGIVYTAQNKYSGSEVMYFSNDLLVPGTNNPTKVKILSDDPLSHPF